MPNPIDPMDREYVFILQRGLVEARNAAYESTPNRARVELEHLHVIPSLLGDRNLHRHYDYVKRVRGTYIDWYEANRPEACDDVLGMLRPAWQRLAAALTNALQAEQPDRWVEARDA